MNRELFDFIAACPTPFQAAAHIGKLLDEAGYTRLCEGDEWSLVPGGKYYVVRNESAVIAFRLPRLDFSGFTLAAAHCDSPCLRIKENAELASAGYMKLSTEIYGGMLRSTWADRPLSAAGRVLVKTDTGIATRLIDFAEPCAVIPNVAIHLNRKANEEGNWNPAVDLVPMLGTEAEKGAFIARVAELAGVAPEDILSTELFLYNPQRGVEWGDMISGPRLDDLQCAFAVVKAFLAGKETTAVPVCCIFDNEEVGSGTKQGACSTFLPDVLVRISEACGKSPAEYRRALANSFLASCDNGHAVHPNHPELADPNHSVRPNGGVVIKYNANQKYMTDGVSAAVFTDLCKQAGVPVQRYANRADMPGGSTLGNLVNTQAAMNGVDIGLAQLAMHSAWESAGAKDTEYMVKALTEVYSRAFLLKDNGVLDY